MCSSCESPETQEELLDLSAQSAEEIVRLSVTPAAGAISTCRYKLKAHQQEDFERIIEVFKAHNVGYFFYNGGNDSMDTAHKVAQMAQERGLDLMATGIPKTIDNDVGGGLSANGETFDVIDHPSGYGSVACYWALNVQNANQENPDSCPSDPGGAAGRPPPRDAVERDPGSIYQVHYGKAPLDMVANSERTLPEAWIAPSRTDVTDAFVRYARPLIGDSWPMIPLSDGIQRFARLGPIFATQTLSRYVPPDYCT